MRWKSWVGVAFGGGYLILALLLVSGPSSTSGWISLSGLTGALATLPVSAVAEALGHTPDYESVGYLVPAIGICMMLAYLLGWGIEWLVRDSAT
jgi:hypothetical protein